MCDGRILVLDTASLYFRAYFGLPTTLKSPDGHPINAVRGLLDFIARLAAQYAPTHIVCAWDDDWRPAWRVDLVPTYKAHRVAMSGGEEVEADLGRQVPLIREALDALGLPVIGMPGYEADDVCASIVAHFPGEGLVVTGDRDLFQLVSARVRVIYLARGIAKHDLVDSAWVQDRFGVRPEDYVDLATLKGDPSDGLPGVAGIGDKTAAALIESYGDLAGIVRAATDSSTRITPHVRQSLIDSVDYLGRAQTVVRAATDLRLPRVAAWSKDQIDRSAFDKLTERLDLGGPAKRILTALSELG